MAGFCYALMLNLNQFVSTLVSIIFILKKKKCFKHIGPKPAHHIHHSCRALTCQTASLPPETILLANFRDQKKIINSHSGRCISVCTPHVSPKNEGEKGSLFGVGQSKLMSSDRQGLLPHLWAVKRDAFLARVGWTQISISCQNSKEAGLARHAVWDWTSSFGEVGVVWLFLIKNTCSVKNRTANRKRVFWRRLDVLWVLGCVEGVSGKKVKWRSFPLREIPRG